MGTNSFTDLLENKFLAWQTKLGKRKTVKDFADYLDVSRPLLSMWMNGSRKPGPDNIEQLAKKLGVEVYDALNLPRPDPLLTEINLWWDLLDEETRQRIHKLANGSRRQSSEENKTQSEPQPYRP